MRSRAGGLALLALVALQATAWAEGDLKSAKEHFFKAERLYKVERFADAFTEYQEAYLAKQDPNFLFNMAQCQRLMGNRDDAIRFYRRFLMVKPNPPNLPIVERHIQALEAMAPPPLGTTPPPLTATAPRRGAVVAPTSSKPSVQVQPTPQAQQTTQTPPAPVAPPPAVVPAMAYAPVGDGSSVRPAVALLPRVGTTPPPLAQPTLPASSLAMAHDPEQPNVVRADLGPGTARDNDETRPVYKKWWFWTAVGAAVVGAVVIGVAAGRNNDPSCEGLALCR